MQFEQRVFFDAAVPRIILNIDRVPNDCVHTHGFLCKVEDINLECLCTGEWQRENCERWFVQVSRGVFLLIEEQRTNFKGHLGRQRRCRPDKA